MKLYRLITGPDDSEFCMRITKLLNNGWELNGNPSVTFNGKQVIAAQSVVKEMDGEFEDSIDLANL